MQNVPIVKHPSTNDSCALQIYFNAIGYKTILSVADMEDGSRVRFDRFSGSLIRACNTVANYCTLLCEIWCLFFNDFFCTLVVKTRTYALSTVGFGHPLVA